VHTIKGTCGFLGLPRLEALAHAAVIEGRATEIIDIGHFLPLAFEDWLHKSEGSSDRRTRRVLLIDDSSFFRKLPLARPSGWRAVPRHSRCSRPIGASISSFATSRCRQWLDERADLSDWRIEILATDIPSDALERAKTAGHGR
jgi:hypothetical protein